MGIYINKGSDGFLSVRNSKYVDKSGLIAIVNSTLNTEQRFSCVTRSRRFGKTIAAKMLLAYYDRSCDSRSLFADLEIASHPSFEKHLNKYPVIYLDITDFTTRDNLKTIDIVSTLQEKVMSEVLSAYPDIQREDDDDLMDVLVKVSLHYNEKFIMIIDEWDAICREALGDEEAMNKYVNSVGCSREVLPLRHLPGCI